MDALDVKATARDETQIDRLIAAKSVEVCKLLRYRNLAPTLDTRTFDWPNDQMGRSWRLWLDANTLISDETGTTVTVQNGAVTLADGSFFIEPANYGPPYNRLEINLGGPAAFSSGQTYQRAVGVTGLFGHSDDSVFAGTTVGTFLTTNNQATFVAATVGVGSLLEINGERCLTTDRSLADTGRTITADLAASNAATLVQTDGATIYPGEILTIDAEQMLVISVAGNNLIVKRQWGGSVLATHSSTAKVYSARLFTLLRGVLGTTVAEHDAGSTWNVWVPPGPANTLTIAEVLNGLEQEQSGYARTVGSGENARNAAGAGIEDARMSAFNAMGRKARQRAV